MRDAPASDDPHAAPKVGACLEHSTRLLFGRFGAQVALGAGVVLALISLCCGIGVVMAPWLLCELTSVQLGQALGRTVEHRRTWIGACVILCGAVLLIGSVGWLTWLGLGTQSMAPSAQASALGALGSVVTFTPGGALALASALVSLVFVLPFMYAPLILIEARAGLGGAVLESARLVVRGGVLPHLLLSLTANVVQVAPLLVAAAIAALRADSELVPLLALCSLPLFSVSLPLGQGMLVSAYVPRRTALADLRRTRLAGRPPRALVAVWAVIVAAPVLSFGLLGASLARPSRPEPGRMPSGGEVIATFEPLKNTQRVHPPGTALEIVVSPRALGVVASDGGGAGAVPLRKNSPIESARVARVRDTYAIELMQAGQWYVTYVDRAGVRQDDDSRARLLDRVPSWALIAMLASLFGTAIALLPVLSSLAELRRSYTLEPGARPAPRALSEARTRTIKRAFAIALPLVPLAALSLWWAARSVIGL
jgi:hypothetical protein